MTSPPGFWDVHLLTPSLSPLLRATACGHTGHTLNNCRAPSSRAVMRMVPPSVRGECPTFAAPTPDVGGPRFCSRSPLSAHPHSLSDLIQSLSYTQTPKYTFSIPDLAPKGQTHSSCQLPNPSTWMSNEHPILHMPKTRFLIAIPAAVLRRSPHLSGDPLLPAASAQTLKPDQVTDSAKYLWYLAPHSAQHPSLRMVVRAWPQHPLLCSPTCCSSPGPLAAPRPSAGSCLQAFAPAVPSAREAHPGQHGSSVFI